MGTAVGYSFIGTCALAFLAIAHARAMKMKEQSRFAAEYFWYSGGLLPLVFACMFLASNGDFPVTAQRVLLFCVGALIGGTFLLGFGEWMRPIQANAQASKMSLNENQPQVVINGGGNVVSIGQIGGITAKIVNINPPLQPELRILGRMETVNPDGSHSVSIKTEVASLITPGLLIIRVDAAGLQDVSIVSAPINGVSMTQKRNVQRFQNSYSAEIPTPRGQYDIVVKTSYAVPISLSAEF